MDNKTIELGGLTFKFTFDFDTYTDLSWLGEYSNTPEQDAVDRKYRGMGRHEYRYFNPTITIAELRKDMHKRGYSKHFAHESAKHSVLGDYDYMENLNNGRSALYVVTTTVLYKEHKLGSASIGELDGDDPELSGYRVDMMCEAIDDCLWNREVYSTEIVALLENTLAELRQPAKQEYKAQRREYFKRWRDLSANYQK